MIHDHIAFMWCEMLEHRLSPANEQILCFSFTVPQCTSPLFLLNWVPTTLLTDLLKKPGSPNECRVCSNSILGKNPLDRQNWQKVEQNWSKTWEAVQDGGNKIKQNHNKQHNIHPIGISNAIPKTEKLPKHLTTTKTKCKCGAPDFKKKNNYSVKCNINRQFSL